MSRRLLLTLLLLWSFTPVLAQRKRQHVRTILVPPPVEVFMYVSQDAVFPGNAGEWITQHLRYPEQAVQSGWTGTVHIMFEISRDGSVHVVSVYKSSGYPTLDNEARRVISEMPPWKPAKVNGRAIPYLMNIPIVFKTG